MKSITMNLGSKVAFLSALLAVSAISNADTLSTFSSTANVFSYTGGVLKTSGSSPVKVKLSQTFTYDNGGADVYVLLAPVAVGAGGITTGGTLSFFYDALGTNLYYGANFGTGFISGNNAAFTFLLSDLSLFDSSGPVVVPATGGGPDKPYDNLAISFSKSSTASAYNLSGDVPSNTQTVPEPFTMALGAAGIAAFAKRKRSK